MSSTDFFNPAKFSWLRPGAVVQWLMQKVVGLTPAQGAWPIAYCCVAPSADLHSELSFLLWGPSRGCFRRCHIDGLSQKVS